MENWANEPSVIRLFAKHYQTGEPMPDSLIAKMKNSSLFNQGFATVEFLAAAILDMEYHKVSEVYDIDVNAFEKAAMDKIGLINEIAPRYRSTYFGHIFAGSYAAGYYVYYWAAVLDHHHIIKKVPYFLLISYLKILYVSILGHLPLRNLIIAKYH